MADPKSLQETFSLVQGESSDDYAKALDLAKKTDLDVETVKRNREVVGQQHWLDTYDFAGFTQDAPRAASWLEHPDNAAVAKDDLDVLGNHERLTRDYSTWEKMKAGGAQGVLQSSKALSQIPGFLTDVALYTVNAPAVVMGDETIKAPEGLYKNALTTALDKSSEAYKLPEFEPKLLDSIKQGNMGRAGSDLAYHLAMNAPSIVQSILTGFSSGAVQASSLGVMGLQSAAPAAEKARDKGMSQAGSVGYGLAYGAAEVIPEKISFGLFKPWASAISNAVGKDTARRVITDLFKTLMFNAAGEGSEEVVTTAAQAATDYYTGVDPDAMRNLPQNVIESFIVGAAMGGGMQGPAIAAVGAQRGVDMRAAAAQTKRSQDLYTALGKDAEASKLRERLPEKYQDALHQIVKDGPVENIFMPVQDFEEYAQAKGVDPMASMLEFGLGAEYSQAKAAGTDITIPLAQFVTKLVPTEHYVGLKDSVKFDATGLTGAEYKRLLKEAATGAKELEAKAEGESAQAAQEYTAGLVKAGLTADQASTNAVLLENTLRKVAASESQRTGAYVSPMDIWKENRIRVMAGGEQAIGALEQSRVRAKGEPAESVLARTFKGMNQAQQEEAFLVDPKTGLLGQNAHEIERETVPAGYEMGHLQFEGTKYFNDSLSHSAGDDVYRVMAQALSSLEADGMIRSAAKVGGDFEFQVAEGQGPAVEAELKKRLPAKARAGGKLLNLSGLGVIVATGQEARNAGNARKAAEVEAGTYGKRGEAPVGATLLGDATEADLPVGMSKGVVSEAMRKEAGKRIKDWRSVYLGKDGMLNASGWDALEKAGRKAYLVHADLDHLGLTNVDTALFGGEEQAREAGDAILAQASAVMQALLADPKYAGIDAAHISGDEYYFQGDDYPLVKQFLAELEVVLNSPLQVVGEGGKVMVKPGITGSFGIGVSHDDAEATALENKRSREAERKVHGWREQAQGESISSLERPMGRSGIAASEGAGQAHDSSVSAESKVGELPQRYLQGGGDQTDTPAFKAWFGESKVVDEAGKPLVVKHGSIEKGLKKFDLKKTVEVEGAFFFTTNEDVANQYTYERAYGDIISEEPLGDVVDAYLKIENPFEPKLKPGQKIVDAIQMGEFIDQAKAAGHDGLIILNIDDSIGQTGDMGDVYVAFSPTQIKSATGNRGTFDAGDPNILNQPVYHGTPHKFNKFTLDHIGSGEGAQAYGWGLYFAGSKSVAAAYRDTLANRWDKISVRGEILSDQHSDVANAVRSFLKDGGNFAKWKKDTSSNMRGAAVNGPGAGRPERAAELRAAADMISALKRADIGNPGSLLTADIPEDSELMDREKKVSEQPAGVRQKLLDGVKSLEGFEKDFLDFSQGKKLEDVGATYMMAALADYAQERKLPGVEQYAPPEAASRYLLSLGIPGLRYLDGSSRSAGAGNYNYVIWDEASIQMLTELEQAQSGTPRGSLQLPTSQQPEYVLSLFKDWNLSTPPHEFGHYYLEMLGKYAILPGASEELTKDYALVREYLGITTDKPTREQHELFANSLLKYLQEGKAPTRQLEGFFAKMKVWLLALYREAGDWASINLTPEIRGVFDRMVASEEGVAEARQEQGLTPLFPAGTTGNLEYDAIIAADAEQASAEVLRRQLELYNKQREAWASKEREQVEAAETERIMSWPINKASEAMTADGGPRIDPNTLPPELHKGFPRKYLSKDAGLPVQVVAEMMGYPDGMDFARQLKVNPSPKQAIRNAVEVEMSHRYPAPISTDELPVEVQDAIHNEKRTQRLALEMQLIQEQNPASFKELMKSVAKRPKAGLALKAYAREMVDGMNVGELKPDRYLRAESKAANDAARLLAANDAVGALEAKQREMLNHEIYLAMRDTNQRLEKSFEKWRGFAKPDEKLAKSRDMALVNAGRAILAQIGLAKDTEKTASAYLEPLAQYDPNAATAAYAIVNSLAPKPQHYTTMPTGEFVSLAEGIDALWRLSRTSNQVKTREGVVERDEARGDLEAQFLSFRTPPIVTQAGTSDADKQSHAVSNVRSLLTRVESWIDLMDNGDINGPFRKYLWTPVKDATIEYRAKLEEQMLALKGLLEPLRGNISMEPITAPELNGFTFQNKGQLLGALLHSGNDSNLSKLLRGYGWGQMDEAGNLDRSKWDEFVARAMQDGTITKQDMDFVQGVWDLLEGTKKPAQQAHLSLYGYTFSEVTAAPVQTPWGEYRGGYFPAVTDKYKVPSQVAKDEKEMFEGGQNSFLFPSTSKGFTKARTDYAAPLSLELGLIGNHVDKVMRFAYLQPTVSSVYRLTKDRGMDALMGNDIRDLLTPWLQRVATQRVATPGMSAAMDRFYSALRSRAGLAQMVLNIPNTLQQFTGLAISAVRIKPSYLTHTAREYVGNSRAMAEFMNEKSSFMRGRVSAQIMDINSDIKEILLNPTAVDTVKDFAQRNGYVLQTVTQGVVDTITWRAAYDQAIATGESEQTAVDAADAAVTLTQGSFGVESVARFETGTPAIRLFTMFAGYFNMQANLLGTEFAKVHQDLGWRKGAGRVLYVGTMGLVIPAIVSKLIMSAFYDKDEDEDYGLATLLQDMGMGIIDNVLGFVPVAGNVGRMAVGKYLTDQPWDDKMSLSPAVKIIESTVSAPDSVYKAIVDKTPPSKAIKDVLGAFSFMTGIPAAPLAKPLGYAADVADREQFPQGALDVARGLTTGRQ